MCTDIRTFIHIWKCYWLYCEIFLADLTPCSPLLSCAVLTPVGLFLIGRLTTPTHGLTTVNRAEKVQNLLCSAVSQWVMGIWKSKNLLRLPFSTIIWPALLLWNNTTCLKLFFCLTVLNWGNLQTPFYVNLFIQIRQKGKLVYTDETCTFPLTTTANLEFNHQVGAQRLHVIMSYIHIGNQHTPVSLFLYIYL